MKSCIYEGTVRHRRFGPVPHEFTYPLFMMYLDLEELPTLFSDRLLWSADAPAPAEKPVEVATETVKPAEEPAKE